VAGEGGGGRQRQQQGEGIMMVRLLWGSVQRQGFSSSVFLIVFLCKKSRNLLETCEQPAINFFSIITALVVEKFIQPINAPQVYST
jgi:hypothetical protein